MPQNQTYSIEFSHIYADKNFAETQYSSAMFLEELIDSWDFSYSTVALIDNYNIEDNVLNENEFLHELDSMGMLPDFWAYEADMIKYADTLLDMIVDKKKKSQYERYISSKHKYPCSFLTCVWYFIRLGAIDGNNLIHSTRQDVNFTSSDRLINILSEDFKGVEQITYDLIRGTNRPELADQIQNLFYQTKPIKNKYSDNLV